MTASRLSGCGSALVAGTSGGADPARRVPAGRLAPGAGVDPDQPDPAGAQSLLAVENRVLAGEEAPAEPGLRDQPGAGRARERGRVQVGARKPGPVPRGTGDERRLGVDRGGQVGPYPTLERIPWISVEIRRVLGGVMMIPGAAEHLPPPGGHRPHLPPPVGAARRDGLGLSQELAGKLADRDLAVEGDRDLRGGPVPVPAQE